MKKDKKKMKRIDIIEDTMEKRDWYSQMENLNEFY